jgi:hypothetical protein
MKRAHWLLVIVSLALVTGCSGEKSAAKKLILEVFPKTTAILFGKFTQLDDRHGCYDIAIKNYNGQQKNIFISLKKENAADPLWSDWVATQSFDACRDAYK